MKVKNEVSEDKSKQTKGRIDGNGVESELDIRAIRVKQAHVRV